ncbi:serine hydrolase domain-containing protein [Sphingomonas sp. HF-S3]|uniref:Serine hydrolase domain-containing protein n=1 Tax=Sphingomonas rustica TaxID=3103142 RepID=A0ABV0B3S7_9SPHN
MSKSKAGRAGRLPVVLALILVACIALFLAVAAYLKPPSRSGGEASPGIKLLEPPADASPARVDYRRLDARITALMQDPDMVGLAVGTVERGRVRFVKGYGETVAGSGVPITPDTVFRWASLSKSVAAALVAGLADEGKLSLDAPVASLHTTLTLPGDTRNVTVADVLSHRLGLVRNAWDDRLEAGEDPKTLRSELGTLAPFCPPATCYAYQNVAFDTASEIVEGATARDYASVARARLFGPLGMTNASIGRAGLQGAGRWAQPHHRGRVPARVDDNYYHVPAAGGVNSSINDLLRWMRAQMGDAPAVLSPKLLDIMHRPRVSTPPHGRRGPMDRALTNAAYGLGWRSYTYAGHSLVGHRGSVDGYGSLILFDPAERSGIVMLWNSNQFKAARLQLEFFDLLYGLPQTDWLELQKPEEVAHPSQPVPGTD